MANKISCSTGRVSLVDPNDFDGQNSSLNMSVPLEDLSIYVQLETSKTARTILTSDGASGGQKSSDNKAAVRISFIEGSEYGGKKSLTTNFTDLTTNLSDESNGESLGITSIDIDFNSSYAPLVTINFVDLRGSAIFQNEDYINKGTNKYATFFQLPYPLYVLTVKGYYGMPVKYELHMTKFSAKFNSQTGNFEITASFIGYTYAMLSDMLLGFLRAIPHTEIGKAEFDKIKEKQPELLTLDDFIRAVETINIDGQKLKAEDEDVAQLNLGKDKLLKLEDIKSTIKAFGSSTDLKASEINQILDDSFKFVITTSASITEDTKKNNFENYKTRVTDAISGFNETNDITIDPLNFTNDVRPEIKKLTMKVLKGDIKTFKPFVGNPQLTDREILDLKTSLETYISGFDYNFNDGAEFNVIDFRKQFRILEEKRTAIDKLNKDNEKIVGDKLRLLVKEKLGGLDPTIRNIVSIFTAAVETFVNSLYAVAVKTVNDDKTLRDEQLKKYLNTDGAYDMKLNTTSPEYYAWPEYREGSVETGLTEKYLGAPGVLNIPQNVTEIKFIDDLLRAFIISKGKVDEISTELANDVTSWIAVNPLDTRLFIDEFPYKRIGDNRKEDVINLIITRAFIYLGLTNRNVTTEEAQAMASFESESIKQSITNQITLTALSQLTINDFYESSGNNGSPVSDDTKVKMMKASGDEYYYNFIYGNENNSVILDKTPFVLRTFGQYQLFEYKIGTLADNQLVTFANQASLINERMKKDKEIYKKRLENKKLGEKAITASEFKILPINNSDSKTWDFDFGDKSAQNAIRKANEGTLFLTNYKTSNQQSGGFTGKTNDGGIYVKFFTPEEYIAQVKQLPVASEPTPLVYEALIQDQATFNNNANQAGFSRGNYGVQDYGFVISSGVTLPYKTIFYEDEFDGHKTNIGTKRTDGTKYDIKPNEDKFLLMDYFEYDKYRKGKVNGGNKYGANRILLTDITAGASDKYSVPFITLFKSGNSVRPEVGLFGSRFYYGQRNRYKTEKNGTKTLLSKADTARAYIFLDSLPFNGTANYSSKNYGVFSKNEILNTFGNRAGFVGVPRLWVAFIGGILWRIDTNNPIFEDDFQIGGGSGAEDPIIWYDSKSEPLPVEAKVGALNISQWKRPSRTEYLATMAGEIKKVEKIIRQLPNQVKEEFKKVFYEFVSSDWVELKSKLEVITTDGDDLKKWDGNWFYLISKIEEKNDKKYLNLKKVKSQFNKTFDDYVIFSPVTTDSDYKYNYFTELRDESEGSKMLVKLISEELIMANMSYKIWDKSIANNDTSNNLGNRGSVSVNKDILKIYLDKIILDLNNIQSAEDKTKTDEIEIFGSDNDVIIKFQLYRTCKSIYDKWIAGSSSFDKIIFKNGNDGRNGVDVGLAKKYGNRSETELAFIDSFRFVDRAFTDIGDKFFVNPVPIKDKLKNEINTSFYDAVTSLLSENNFDFIALPTFINYNKPETLASIFEPLATNESFGKGIAGPSFVSVYVGQTSKQLDFKNNNYPNDGVSFRCNGGQLGVMPIEFTEKEQEYENNVGVFAVNYSQQNQNIFKDITLDQNEFTETAESLEIISSIAGDKGENDKTSGGQSMFSVYTVRSYKAEVEMMGNAMIQPMMYFQLNNIPMFHGAYMITRVKHSIKPNTMSTNFNGVRIRYVKTPLIEASDFFMSLLDTVDGAPSDSSTNLGSPQGGSPIVDTIRENGGENGNIEAGNIFLKSIPKIEGVKNPKTGDENKMLFVAVEPFVEMMKDWVAWMKSEPEVEGKKIKFKGNNGNYVNITSIFRTVAEQQRLRDEQGSSAAIPGRSNHGWAIAVDFNFLNEDGNIILNFVNKKPNNTNGFNFDKNPAIFWLFENSYKYGFMSPGNLRDGNGLDEFWHWEYHGTAARCLLKNNAFVKLYGKTKSYTIKPTEDYKPFVLNPKTSKGERAIYDDNNCNYKDVGGDGTVEYPKSGLTVKQQPLPSKNKGTMDFYNKLLAKLGAPITEGNKFFLMAWHQIENSNCNWNAFNTKQSAGKSVVCITSGVNKNVQKYNNADEGVEGTYKTLIKGNNGKGYQNIIAALRNGIKDKQGAYDVAFVEEQKGGDLHAWKNGPAGGPIKPNTYVTGILGSGKMSGANITGSS
jgi:hypothetical protein